MNVLDRESAVGGFEDEPARQPTVAVEERFEVTSRPVPCRILRIETDGQAVRERPEAFGGDADRFEHKSGRVGRKEFSQNLAEIG